MIVERFDHVVLTVKSLDATCDFYTRVLGMKAATLGSGRKSLTFGSQKINLHEQGKEASLRADKPTPGSADLCFITDAPLEEVEKHIRSCGVEIIEGPVKRQGAMGAMTSLYFRDPDLNLLEVSSYAI